MAEHNVAIACSGRGTNAAAHAAANLLRTFRNIRFGLLVGVGGGAAGSPDRSNPLNDIRLGDVVVSMPAKSHGGVVQYDMGRWTNNAEFQIESHLNKPPTVLSTAIMRLQSDHDLENDRMNQYIQDVASNRPRRRAYRFPGRDQDRLFRADYRHHADAEGDCSMCDAEQAVERLERETDEPAVHYGLIASSNAVMMSAQHREEIRREHRILCFEMEAAGLMDNFPCVVIRGISDYSDDHKNKIWQPYSAVAAAAYAKDLLRVIHPHQVDRMEMAAIRIAEECHMLMLLQEQQRRAATEMLEWLTPMDYGFQHSDNLSQRQPGTGQWLLDSEEFQRFLEGGKQTLFCPGIPGAGKTIITSIVVDHLLARFQREATIAVAYIYCSYQRRDEQKAEYLLASLLKQLAQRLPSLPGNLESLILRSRDYRTRPSFEEIVGALRSVAAAFSRIFIIVDALDECPVADGCLSRFLSEIFLLQRLREASIFATSRPLPEITGRFKESITLQIRATEEDVRSYLDGQIFRLPRFLTDSPSLQEETKTAIIQAVNGMFQLAQLHLASLVGTTSPKSLRAKLQSLPTGSGAYDKAYDNAMARVEGQPREQVALAKEVLSWVTCAWRPLRTTELQHALAVELGETTLDGENLPQIEDMVSVCVGLVTVDQQSGIIRLAHYTTQEYLERTQGRWFPHAQADITQICLSYLSFDAFQSGTSPSYADYKERLDANPLYHYAACSWGLHACRASAFPESVITFLGKTALVQAASEPLFELQQVFLFFGFVKKLPDFPNRITGLHLAAYFGLGEAVRILRERYSEVDVCDSHCRTPLSYAAENGRVVAAELLLEKNAFHGTRDETGKTPLSFASRAGRAAMVKLLIEHGATLDSQDKEGRTPLLYWSSMAPASL
ncbi:hypothetical protein BJY01DRAFT_236447 [Aspergillus pseudoustus]|uniref:NACHT domain-containing protein n=1 Tax=Aspergillus pseudoustus TaxID=1810923 RepID=A0ABR4JML8_9EURO